MHVVLKSLSGALQQCGDGGKTYLYLTGKTLKVLPLSQPVDSLGWTNALVFAPSA